MFEAALQQVQTPEEPELLYAPIIYSMSGGGKRLRPVLLLITTGPLAAVSIRLCLRLWL